MLKKPCNMWLHWLVHLQRSFTLRYFVLEQYLHWLALHHHSLPSPHQPPSSQPNLLFLEPLPLLTATEALTDVWIGGGFLTNYLTPHTASEKEERPHHFLASPLMECVCLSGFAAVSPSHNPQPIVWEERETWRRLTIINLISPIFSSWHFISETSFHLMSY